VASAGRLAYGLIVLTAVAWAWARALERQLSNPAATSGSGGRRRAAGVPRLRPRSPATAVWLKDLRYLWRAPVQRANIVTGVVTSGFVLLPFLTGARHASEIYPYAGVAVAFFLQSNLSLNLFGVDGGGFCVYVLTGADAGEVVRGKALAVATVVATIAALAAVAGAALSGAWSELASALLLAAAVILVAAGIGAVASVRSPFPVAMETPTFGRARRQRGRGTPGVGLAAFVTEAALIGVLLGMVAISRFALGIGTLPGAIAAAVAGAAVAATALTSSARRLRERLPEVLLALSPRG
jgi:hypothetical protein